jgi:uncharacterized alkaline shock family protein YloU
MLVPFVNQVSVIIFDAVTFLQENITLSAIFAFIAVLSLWLFAAQFRGSSQSKLPNSVVLQAEEGEVRIALTAIESLVQQAAAQVKGVREVRPTFFTRNEGLGVHIKTTVSSEDSIPELSAQLQNVVKEHVLRIAGVSIEEIKILVENVSAGARGRVELR